METLTTGDCAKLLGVDEQTIRRMADGGDIASVRLTDGSWRRIPKQAIIELAQERKITLDWSLIDKQ